MSDDPALCRSVSAGTEGGFQISCYAAPQITPQVVQVDQATEKLDSRTNSMSKGVGVEFDRLHSSHVLGKVTLRANEFMSFKYGVFVPSYHTRTESRFSCTQSWLRKRSS